MQSNPINELISFANDPATRNSIYKQGRNFVYRLTRSYKNACAATASAWLCHVGLIDKQYARVADLSDLLIELGWQRIDKPLDVRAGDFVFVLDGNGNGISDHVILALSMPDDKCRITALDNQKGGQPHVRNLRKGWPWYTPMWYALRYVPPVDYSAEPGTPLHNALSHIIGNLRAIYSQWEYIPDDARRALNVFANHHFLDPARGEG